ncbi:multidrug resistance protein Stp [mine drainage metagenome]|uniref:Multidrug resistance protein Stp n=1 Tax=mine drainage metagenome TaxID=410659 RepID=A0A1J5QUR2_9ZZZZ
MGFRSLGQVKSDHYKWVALSNTTLGMLMATINSSIILISLPAIFRGVGIDPLAPGNVGYLLWLMMGYMLITAVLVVSLGRLGDMLGRVRIYNLGFAVFSTASIILALDPIHGGGGAMWLVVWRLVQGIGGAMLFANSSAIIVDAFPAEQRGLAMGINQVAAISGSFIGLIAGGLLSVLDWRLVFWVSVPFGVLGTFWGYHSLRDNGRRIKARIDWWGNATFAIGLTALLGAIVYGIQPYGGRTMGWTSPKVLTSLIGGLLFLVAFMVIESRVESPMFNLKLFRIRAFATGSAAGLLAAIARGGLQFMLIIWLQGIWLPLHGYKYEATPLWAGIYLLPLTIGFLIAGPLAGFLSDRHGARVLSTGGLLVFSGSFVGLLFVPTDFHYWVFAVLVLLNGVGGGLFSAPNSTAIMNSVPAQERGGAAGVQAALMNSGMVLSMGIFFSLMIVGLANSLPASMSSGLLANGVGAAQAKAIASLPPVGSLFSSLLGYNPLQSLLGSQAASHVSTAQWQTLTSKQFFPHLISAPFHRGLVIVFGMAIAMSLIAAVFSALRGRRFVHVDELPDARHVHEHIGDVAFAGGAVPGEPAIEDDRR